MDTLTLTTVTAWLVVIGLRAALLLSNSRHFTWLATPTWTNGARFFTYATLFVWCRQNYATLRTSLIGRLPDEVTLPATGVSAFTAWFWVAAFILAIALLREKKVDEVAAQ